MAEEKGARAMLRMGDFARGEVPLPILASRVLEPAEKVVLAYIYVWWGCCWGELSDEEVARGTGLPPDVVEAALRRIYELQLAYRVAFDARQPLISTIQVNWPEWLSAEAVENIPHHLLHGVVVRDGGKRRRRS